MSSTELEKEPAMLIDVAKSVPIEAEIARRGIKLIGRGPERYGPCPVCGGRDRFSINTSKKIWNCRGCSKGGVLVARDGCRMGSTAARVLHGTHDVGCPSGGGEADYDILAGRAATRYITLAEFGGILIDLYRRCNSFGTARNDVLDGLRRSGISGGTFRGVQRSDAAARSGSDVNQPATIT